MESGFANFPPQSVERMEKRGIDHCSGQTQRERRQVRLFQLKDEPEGELGELRAEAV